MSPYIYPILKHKNINIDYIFQSVYRHTGIKKEDIISRKRDREISESRFIAMNLMYEKISDMSLSQIANVFNRQHCDVLYAKKQINKHRLLDEYNKVINQYFK